MSLQKHLKAAFDLDFEELYEREGLLKLNQKFEEYLDHIWQNSLDATKSTILEPVQNLAAKSRKWRIHEHRTAAYSTYVRSGAQGIRHLRPSQVEILNRF